MNCPIIGALRAFAIPAAFALFATVAVQAQTLSQGDINTGYFGNVAIKGYDPVAYFTMGKATRGDPAINSQWLGAEWHFANAEDRDLFVANPIAMRRNTAATAQTAWPMSTPPSPSTSIPRHGASSTESST